jgi:hypothetical protein
VSVPSSTVRMARPPLHLVYLHSLLELNSSNYAPSALIGPGVGEAGYDDRISDDFVARRRRRVGRKSRVRGDGSYTWQYSGGRLNDSTRRYSA